MQSGELKSGMPDEAEQENIVAWYLVVWRMGSIPSLIQYFINLFHR